MPLKGKQMERYHRWIHTQPEWKRQVFNLLTRQWSIGVAHWLVETKPRKAYTVMAASLATATGMHPLVTDKEWDEAFAKVGPGEPVSLALSLVAINQENVDSVAPYMDEPIFLAQMEETSVFPIDGFHRIYRAMYVDKRELLNAYVLTQREEKLCRLL